MGLLIAFLVIGALCIIAGSIWTGIVWAIYIGAFIVVICAIAAIVRWLNKQNRG